MNFKTERKPIRQANVVAVGGMIALGKTSLIQGLEKHYTDCKSVFELNENDELQSLLLKGLYDKSVSPDVFQLYFVNTRFQNYKNSINDCSPDKLVFFDRTIFEDRLFAHQNMLDMPIQFSYYDKLWQDLTNELLYLVGTPIVYIILDGSFETFKDRIFKRNRSAEVENWEINKDYFFNLHKVYIPFMEGVCKMYGIPYYILNVDNKSREDILKEAVDIIENKKNNVK